MADKGFLVKPLLSEKNISLNIPPFLQGNRPFTSAKCSKTEEIASLRIHVERYISRMKENHLFDSKIPLTVLGGGMYSCKCQRSLNYSRISCKSSHKWIRKSVIIYILFIVRT